ncbi:hypothetical protein [Dactylosporangium sp. CS-033363]|uniref:hypothetical protein n=1 Tax=Dactylosporangium sp. CS-033363 TaxID=3239935 RepID=UPI003D9146C9
MLYSNVYIPLTEAWFAALAASPAKDELLRRASERDLLESLERLNALCRQLVVETIDDAMVAAAYGQRDAIHWMDGDWAEPPGPDPTLEQIRVALGNKLRRNISLGVLEAVLCLESACRYGRDELELSGEPLRRTLLGSRQLYASLAVLHDQQERERLSFLTGLTGYLEYPANDYPHVILGKLAIQSDKFIRTDTPDGPRIRFVTSKLSRIDEAVQGPTMRCPAHRPSGGETGETYNDILWNLLIDIYQRSGRFD